MAVRCVCVCEECARGEDVFNAPAHQPHSMPQITYPDPIFASPPPTRPLSILPFVVHTHTRLGLKPLGGVDVSGVCV